MVPELHEIRDPRELHWHARPIPAPGEGIRILVWIDVEDYPPVIAVWESVAPLNGIAPRRFAWQSQDPNIATTATVKWWAWLQWPANVIVT